MFHYAFPRAGPAFGQFVAFFAEIHNWNTKTRHFLYVCEATIRGDDPLLNLQVQGPNLFRKADIISIFGLLAWCLYSSFKIVWDNENLWWRHGVLVRLLYRIRWSAYPAVVV